MLEQTFCHIPGIGTKTEQGLWTAGIRSWREVEGHPALPPRRAALLARHAGESLARLEEGDMRFFAERWHSEPALAPFSAFSRPGGLSRHRDDGTR